MLSLVTICKNNHINWEINHQLKGFIKKKKSNSNNSFWLKCKILIKNNVNNGTSYSNTDKKNIDIKTEYIVFKYSAKIQNHDISTHMRNVLVFYPHSIALHFGRKDRIYHTHGWYPSSSIWTSVRTYYSDGHIWSLFMQKVKW